ncbi:MAG: hypothetical protein FWC41_05570, partial [Firmicutes bacterium]|nr:hypothetical protein [Bacillota bacterium]
MNFIKSWAFTVVTGSLICTLIEFVLPECHQKRIANTVLNVFFILCILYPFKKFEIQKNFNFFKLDEQKIENKLESRFKFVAKKNIANQIKIFLEKNGAKAKSIIIHINESARPPVTCEIIFEEGVENKKILSEKIKNEFK